MLEKQLLSNLVNKQRLSKAKYELVYDGYVIYHFVTTTRNTEDCLDILSKKFHQMRLQHQCYRVFKTVNGERELLWYHKPARVKHNKKNGFPRLHQ